MAKEPKQKPAPVGDNAAKAEFDTFDYHKSRILRHRRGPLALAEAAYKKLLKADKNLLSEAKNDGLMMGEFKRHLKTAELERQKPGVGKRQAETMAKYDRMGGLLEGQQGDLFDGLTPTPGEREDQWFKRGYEDIKYGALDPEGFVNEDGSKSPGMLMPGIKPSYVAQENFTAWSDGAHKAQEEINAEFLRRQGGDTPVEQAAVAPSNTDAEKSNQDEFEDAGL